MNATATTKLERANIGLSDDSRALVVDSLNEVLADLFVLYTKARNYHWNVVGEQFFVLHAEFEKLYDALAEDIDSVAERTRALGGIALGTMGAFLERATLKEATDIPAATKMVADLEADYEHISARLRAKVKEAESLNDLGTADFLTGLMKSYEKTAWMLRASRR